MNWYKEYKKEWTEIIETVAAEEHRQTQMVEKDTIQSMILFKLSKSELPFVFKGGTSLFKAYGLILNRKYQYQFGGDESCHTEE
ncbi:nucleotidyl transferase AbiEii/AbiGii toxin family protein [Anaerovibrio sp.]|uniref:nucleotidyl transferase AbiEii/AbiGii toxin family protein n=1 Tax=Anaerovibrio sp. TaxID=1872532 RepID=UPI0025C3087E|nr:nucleotidyl transferase AbiEii/AbiGii toxin family protein [Anaerovibrio sp.]